MGAPFVTGIVVMVVGFTVNVYAQPGSTVDVTGGPDQHFDYTQYAPTNGVVTGGIQSNPSTSSGPTANSGPAAGKGYHSFKDIVDSVGKTISTRVIPIFFILAVLAFMYNIAFFLLNMGNEKERETFKKYSINALIALTVLLAVWGIVGIFTQTFFQATPFIPQLPTSD